MLLSSVEGPPQQTQAHPSVTNCSRSLNHTEILRIATREHQERDVAAPAHPGERTPYVLGHILTSGPPPPLLQCRPVAPSWLRSSASTGCSVCPPHGGPLGGCLEPRVAIAVEPQLVAGHLFHFINTIKPSTDKGCCPLTVSLSLRQSMGMTFCLCSRFHNDTRGQA